MAKPPAKRWYAATAILSFRIKAEQRQKEFVVWENVYLIKAASAEGARLRAAKYARAASGDDDGDLSLNGKPAILQFEGIRKIVECLGDPTTNKPMAVARMHDGVEATYSVFVIRGRAALTRLVCGKGVDITYDE
jgi:hypothetical protein